MGVGPFKSSEPRREYGKTEYVYIDKPVAPNPNPYKYKIIKEKIINKKSILLVKYQGCTTFGGKKLLLLNAKWRHQRPLDPHLLSDKHWVLARFQPNELGWKLAKTCAKLA